MKRTRIVRLLALGSISGMIVSVVGDHFFAPAIWIVPLFLASFALWAGLIVVELTRLHFLRRNK